MIHAIKVKLKNIITIGTYIILCKIQESLKQNKLKLYFMFIKFVSLYPNWGSEFEMFQIIKNNILTKHRKHCS